MAMMGELDQDITTKVHKHPFLSQTPTTVISGPFVTLAILFPHIACGRIGEEGM